MQHLPLCNPTFLPIGKHMLTRSMPTKFLIPLPGIFGAAAIHESASTSANYDERTADNDFEEVGTNAKIEISPFQKSTGESLYRWLQRVNPNFWPGGPIDEGDSWVPPVVERGRVIAGLPAILLHWSETEFEYLDARAVVYKVVAEWAASAD